MTTLIHSAIIIFFGNVFLQMKLRNVSKNITINKQIIISKLTKKIIMCSPLFSLLFPNALSFLIVAHKILSPSTFFPFNDDYVLVLLLKMYDYKPL